MSPLHAALAFSNTQDPIGTWGEGRWDTFHAFTPLHAAAVAGSVFVLAALGIAGARLRGRQAEASFRRALFWTALLFQVCNLIFYTVPWQWEVSLPLHVCDLAGLVAVAALRWETRWLRAVLYYWGIGLSTQAFITPVVEAGPAHMRFWLFWISHLVIVGAAVYDLAGRRFRPTWRDFRAITFIMLLYGAVIIPLDALSGWNYGYVGKTAVNSPTLLDKFGPWPGRLVWMLLLVEGVFALLTAVWMVGKRPDTEKQKVSQPLPAENL